MIKLVAVAFTLAAATSAHAMPLAPLHQPDGMITQAAKDAAQVGYELMVSAWQGRPFGMFAEKPAGVHDGLAVLAFASTETPLRNNFRPHCTTRQSIKTVVRSSSRLSFELRVPVPSMTSRCRSLSIDHFPRCERNDWPKSAGE